MLNVRSYGGVLDTQAMLIELERQEKLLQQEEEERLVMDVPSVLLEDTAPQDLPWKKALPPSVHTGAPPASSSQACRA